MRSQILLFLSYSMQLQYWLSSLLYWLWCLIPQEGKVERFLVLPWAIIISNACLLFFHLQSHCFLYFMAYCVCTLCLSSVLGEGLMSVLSELSYFIHITHLFTDVCFKTKDSLIEASCVNVSMALALHQIMMHIVGLQTLCWIWVTIDDTEVFHSYNNRWQYITCMHTYGTQLIVHSICSIGL